MLKTTKLIVFFALILLLTIEANAQNRTYRDTNGNKTGSSVTSGNTTTYRDPNGNRTGTSTYNSSTSTTTYRDKNGNTKGYSR